jgi:hypothetical protein
MVHFPVPAVVCTVCGSDDWMAVKPGTAADAKSYQGVLELFRCEEIPTVAWCEKDWPWRNAKKTPGAKGSP